MRDKDQTTRYFSFPLPSLSDGIWEEGLGVRRVVLGEADILSRFDCEYHRYVQGACFHKGLIYSLEGFTEDKSNPPAIRIIDTENGVQREKWLFEEWGLSVEPEMIDFDGDIGYYGDAHGGLYRLET